MKADEVSEQPADGVVDFSAAITSDHSAGTLRSTSQYGGIVGVELTVVIQRQNEWHRPRPSVGLTGRHRVGPEVVGCVCGSTDGTAVMPVLGDSTWFTIIKTINHTSS